MYDMKKDDAKQNAASGCSMVERLRLPGPLQDIASLPGHDYFGSSALSSNRLALLES